MHQNRLKDLDEKRKKDLDTLLSEETVGMLSWTDTFTEELSRLTMDGPKTADGFKKKV